MTCDSVCQEQRLVEFAYAQSFRMKGNGQYDIDRRKLFFAHKHQFCERSR